MLEVASELYDLEPCFSNTVDHTNHLLLPPVPSTMLGIQHVDDTGVSQNGEDSNLLVGDVR